MTDTKDGHFFSLVPYGYGYMADAFLSQTKTVSVYKIHGLGSIFGWRFSAPAAYTANFDFLIRCNQLYKD